jgi:predicted membrane chloride channel (bestrophin family)
MCTLYRDVMSREKLERLVNLIKVFPMFLAEHLGYSCEPNLGLTKHEDLTFLCRFQNRPLCIADLLAMEIKSIPDQTTQEGQILFSSRERLSMLGLVEKMTNCIAACERIVQTKIPLNYARHTGRFMMLWLLSLPFALVGGLGAATVPVLGLISWGLFGIWEIGLMIEDPFKEVLNLGVIIRTISDDVTQTMETMGVFNVINGGAKVPVDRERLENPGNGTDVKGPTESLHWQQNLAEAANILSRQVEETASAKMNDHHQSQNTSFGI